MNWTKTDHEGQVMWERDGERLKEPPDERRVEVRDRVVVDEPGEDELGRPVTRVVYRTGIDPQFLLLAWTIGFVMGMLLATVLR